MFSVQVLILYVRIRSNDVDDTRKGLDTKKGLVEGKRELLLPSAKVKEEVDC